MPRFEFECQGGCGKFEVFRRYEELGKIHCPGCHGEVKRIFGPLNFTLGWKLSDDSHIPGHRDELVRNV